MNTPSIPNITKVGPVKFVREVTQELVKVTWPTKQETIKLTVLVIILSLIVGLFVGGIDTLFLKIQTLFFGGK